MYQKQRLSQTVCLVCGLLPVSCKSMLRSHRSLAPPAIDNLYDAGHTVKFQPNSKQPVCFQGIYFGYRYSQMVIVQYR